MLYPEWDFFADLINSNNSYKKLIAVRIIANITKIDAKNEFEELFDKYYSLLGDRRMVAGHLASNSGKIVKAKPELETKITTKLLNIDKTNHKHKELIKGYAIGAFREYFEETKNRKEIVEFVKDKLESKSLKTRKIAEKFLKKWEK